MAFELGIFGDESLTPGFIDYLICEQWPQSSRVFAQLWDYYTNPVTAVLMADPDAAATGRGYVQAQEVGLPSRITGKVYLTGTEAGLGKELPNIQRKEVVIENDIAWRINAMVDFLFGKPITIQSTAADPARRRDIQFILKAVFDTAGGAVFFQDLAVLGAVYGFVDCIVRVSGRLAERLAAVTSSLSYHTDTPIDNLESILRLAADIALEPIDAPRALPVLEESDYKRICTYVQHVVQLKNQLAEESSSFLKLLTGRNNQTQRKTVALTEILGANAWQRYEDGELIAEGFNPLGRVPVVHIQNLPQPGCYEGLSDVAQLRTLQDELNTRLSDRASRITMQSFKMYLAKGLENLANHPVAPGRMWSTDNPDATIEAFGGDAASPSEDAHIAEIREAMDKVSGVTPVVAGVLKNKLGNLSSAVALKMTFMGMLCKTYRKQLTYGQGIREICRMVLELLDVAGVYLTEAGERNVEIDFPNPVDDAIISE